MIFPTMLLNKYLLHLLVVFLCTLLFFIDFPQVAAQSFAFRFHDSVAVFHVEKRLLNPWAGGLNASQFSTIDLDGDGTEDLVVFDRTHQKVSTFLRKEGQYIYQPAFESIFPAIQFWMLLIDYNCDGKKDLFTASPNGIRVFLNEGQQRPAFRMVKDPLSSRGFSGFEINLKVDITDIPAIVDLDGDGDLDILTFVPSIGGTVEMHRNLSRERFNSCDSLVFEKMTDAWGNFEECEDCEGYFFNQLGQCRVARTEHAGSTLLALDVTGNGAKDLLVGEVDCPNLIHLINEGTTTDPVINRANYQFPPASPVNLRTFPAAFFEDVDGDGLKDLLVSPNVFFNEGDLSDFTASNWLYLNKGTAQTPDFQFETTTFLQDEMIEWGESAFPGFLDFDGDGVLDMVVANRGRLFENDEFFATLALYKNTGTQQNPEFTLVNDDYLGFSEERFMELKIQFTDLNGDQKTDLVFSGRRANTNQIGVRYLLNKAAAPGMTPVFNRQEIQQIAVQVEQLDQPYFFDVDRDGQPDLLVGKFRTGALEYFRNLGNLTFERTNDAFGGLGFNSMQRERTVAVADLNSDGKPDLITGDRSGTLRVFPGFQDHIGRNFPVETAVLLNQTLQRLEQTRLGNGIYPVPFGKDLIIGSQAGGLYFLQNISTITSLPPEEIALDLSLFPNPAHGSFTLLSPRALHYQIFSLTGQPMPQKGQLLPDSPQVIDVSAWPAGLYVVRLSAGSKVWVRKILVE